MSLILAVEPDRRRAAQLSAMARAHLDAELIVAPSVAQAFTALGERVPDVMLTGPLLPAAEECALTDYLRLIGPAGTHVPLLTIPLLASTAGSYEPGLLSRFRRTAKPESIDGCDPAAFAGQIAEYLREAGERRQPVEPVEPLVLEPVIEPTVLPAAIEPVLEVAAPEPELTEFLIEPLEPLEPLEPVGPPEPEPEEVLSLVPLAAPLPELTDEIDLSSLLDDSLPELTFVDESDYQPAVLEPELAAAPPPMLVPVAAPAQQPPPGTNVQQVITIPTGGGTHVQAAVNVAVAVSVQVAASVNVVTPPPRRGKPRPLQDEWGFFDPNQCGFPALLAKLDEIAQKDDESQ